ncbi:MAG: carbohydrate binding domain-containing protein [Candidatus Omnitrophica bacterium]|nr:carbohydrate binding domain-containing protein [Candidatus Omnitrophota bacterium]
MKTRMGFFILAAMISSVFASEEAFLKELIRNGDFEEEKVYTISAPHKAAGLVMPEGWFMDWTHCGYAELVKDPDICRSGKQCLMMQYREDPEREENRRFANVYSTSGFEIKPGKKYLVRLWVKGDFPGKPFQVSFYEYRDEGKKYLGYLPVKPEKPVLLSNEWQFFQAIYEPKSPDVESARFVLATVRPNTDAMWVDGISMREYDGRSLAELMKTSAMEKERAENEKLLSGHKELGDKYGETSKELYSRFNELLTNLTPEPSPEIQYVIEKKFLALLEKYTQFAKDLKVDAMLLP